VTEQPLHPEDELIELALGEVDEPRRSELIRHLVDCPSCHAAYETISVAVDAVIPAAPRIAPPVGFDQRALAAMGAHAGPAPVHQPSSRRRKGLLLAVAAALLAAVVGGLGAIWFSDDDAAPSEPPLAGDTGLLRKSDGEVVGTASVSSLEGRPVVVVSISRPAVGVPYHCRLLYENGRQIDAGRWTVDEPEGHTWITRARKGNVVRMDLVTDDGRVWSSARFS
jgi:anti-sigma factor RsiW